MENKCSPQVASFKIMRRVIKSHFSHIPKLSPILPIENCSVQRSRCKTDFAYNPQAAIMSTGFLYLKLEYSSCFWRVFIYRVLEQKCFCCCAQKKAPQMKNQGEFQPELHLLWLPEINAFNHCYTDEMHTSLSVLGTYSYLFYSHYSRFSPSFALLTIFLC